MTIEFLHEMHETDNHHAMARLDGEYEGGHVRESFVHLKPHSVKLHRLSSYSENDSFHMTATEADAFVEAWLAFKANTEQWLQIEAEKKARAEQAEQSRQLSVWKQVEELAQSIPGLEIIAREEDVWDEDDQTGTTTAWEVLHRALGRGNKYLYSADQVMLEVQGLIEEYNQHLQHLENIEEANWNNWWPAYIETAKQFLATHRAHQTNRTSPLVETNA